MEGVLAILLIFGGPLVFLISRRYFSFREKVLELERLRIEKGQLTDGSQTTSVEARLENLEDIVTSVDFELNQRLNRLAMATSRMLPAPLSPTPAAKQFDAGASLAVPPKGGTVADSRSIVAYPGEFVPGQVVAERYHILRELGRGGMGAVYLAKDDILDEEVALKTVLTSPADDRSLLSERFRREVQAARRVTHPNVIRIHDLGQEGPVLFLSMEFLAGTTLEQRVKTQGTPTSSEARRILRAVADGVAAAHDVGVIHRDLKPHNILLGATGTSLVKVIDFGLASASFASDLTATGMIMGTPEYMAPEQIRGNPCDERADVYALGSVAYFVLCGRPPFLASTPIAVGFSQVHDAPEPPSRFSPGIPKDLESAILRALSKDPAERFASGREWRAALGD